jgi:hypothetical protein
MGLSARRYVSNSQHRADEAVPQVEHPVALPLENCVILALAGDSGVE